MKTKQQLLAGARRRTRIALSYAEDGAFYTATKLLREVADDLEAEYMRRREIILKATEEPADVPRP